MISLRFDADDGTENPASLDEESRAAYGISRQLPSRIEAALDALEKDEVLQRLLPDDMVKTYLIMKRTEQEELLKGMEPWERRIWLIERY